MDGEPYPGAVLTSADWQRRMAAYAGIDVARELPVLHCIRLGSAEGVCAEAARFFRGCYAVARGVL